MNKFFVLFKGEYFSVFNVLKKERVLGLEYSSNARIRREQELVKETW